MSLKFPLSPGFLTSQLLYLFPVNLLCAEAVIPLIKIDLINSIFLLFVIIAPPSPQVIFLVA